MKDTAVSNRRLNQFFISWIVLGNGAVLVTPLPDMVDHWLGTGFLWALLIPLACLIWLNPRRSCGLLLATAGTLVLVVLRISIRWFPKRLSNGSKHHIQENGCGGFATKSVADGVT